MKITREMLDVAMKKAVEAGLLPRHACLEDAATHEELLRYVLQAALEAVESEQHVRHSVPRRAARVYRPQASTRAEGGEKPSPLSLPPET